MAKFDAKTFNAEAFGKYMSAVPNVKLNKLRSSKAIAKDARLVETFKNNTQTGTVYATIPYFGLLGGEAQNYDGVTDLKTEGTTTFDQGVFTYGRMMGWTEADFSYDVTGGADFMANVRNQINEYWNSVDQDVLLSILKGIFSMTGDICDLPRLVEIKKKYAQPRRSQIIGTNDIQEYNEEEHVEAFTGSVVLTREGYFKKISQVSLRMSDNHLLKENDEIIKKFIANNKDFSVCEITSKIDCDKIVT